MRNVCIALTYFRSCSPYVPKLRTSLRLTIRCAPRAVKSRQHRFVSDMFAAYGSVCATGHVMNCCSVLPTLARVFLIPNFMLLVWLVTLVCAIASSPT